MPTAPGTLRCSCLGGLPSTIASDTIPGIFRGILHAGAETSLEREGDEDPEGLGETQGEKTPPGEAAAAERTASCFTGGVHELW